jgi:hypothetical protein
MGRDQVPGLTHFFFPPLRPALQVPEENISGVIHALKVSQAGKH